MASWLWCGAQLHTTNNNTMQGTGVQRLYQPRISRQGPRLTHFQKQVGWGTWLGRRGVRKRERGVSLSLHFHSPFPPIPDARMQQLKAPCSLIIHYSWIWRRQYYLELCFDWGLIVSKVDHRGLWLLSFVTILRKLDAIYSLKHHRS